ncbi:unnamed protein product [Rangifer tarandus platyrhynchus]|uniref:Uncharacterized protein n=2 Tax=Rangifer tarandus platyrhynchus TaxID=3082113 RepID=A0ACB0F7F4_RANTA|nr:unnamed protein product [Rangifer tarandus platyrhynchus]CAI9708006.1 unnamed protein product [Rangifer tarandus platyrhynchus]
MAAARRALPDQLAFSEVQRGQDARPGPGEAVAPSLASGDSGHLSQHRVHCPHLLQLSMESSGALAVKAQGSDVTPCHAWRTDSAGEADRATPIALAPVVRMFR